MKNNYLVVIAGPTASGKTRLSVELAKSFDSEIISADSRQIYKELHIGTASPGEDILKTVKHHFIKYISIYENYNASRYEQEVLALLNALFREHQLIFLTGGSGLYIDAVCNGIDDFPETDSLLRKQLEDTLQNEGIESLRKQLKMVDPFSYAKTDLRNPKRIQKALEISLMTGKPYSSFLSGASKKRPFEIIRIALNPDRKELYNNINKRVLRMIEEGLEAEARKFYPVKHLNALNTVGYREMFAYFEGSVSLNEAITLIQANTRKYARKQITWFRKNNNYSWFHPNDKKEIESFIRDKISHIIHRSINAGENHTTT